MVGRNHNDLARFLLSPPKMRPPQDSALPLSSKRHMPDLTVRVVSGSFAQMRTWGGRCLRGMDLL